MLLFAWASPDRPLTPTDPGSNTYPFQYEKKSIASLGRSVEVFLPRDSSLRSRKFPVLVFGHGQAIDVAGYEASFIHLAQKGVAVVFPTYDTGFFDQNWLRMADDFNQMAHETLSQLENQLDSSQVIYAGHSKGGYVALIASGADSLGSAGLNLGALILFAPAGYDKGLIKKINPQLPVTLFWGESDNVIKKSLIDEIYENLPNLHKQLILIKNYPDLKADHFYPLSKSYFFGGRNGISAYHFYGTWKWLIGGVLDLSEGAHQTNKYLYGAEALTTGLPELKHEVKKSW